MRKEVKRYGQKDGDIIDTEGSWAISYGDLITLLLSFFVIYFSANLNESSRKPTDNAIITKLEGEIEKVGDEIFSENIDMKVYKTGNSFLIYFAGTSFFDSGKVNLKKETFDVLSKIVQKIKPYLGSYKLKVRAFTDLSKVKTYSRYHNNLELSALRAVATMEALVKNGIPRSRMEVVGFGPMNEKLLDFLNIEKGDDSQKKALSRSIMLLLKKEST